MLAITHEYQQLLDSQQASDMWCTGDLDSAHSKAEAQAEEAASAAMSTALLEKQLKSKLSIAADHFNRAPSKGLDYFQVAARTHADCAEACSCDEKPLGRCMLAYN